MQTFKRIDAWVSLVLFVILLITNLVIQDVSTLIYSYFIMGGWHMISMLVHIFGTSISPRHSARTAYHWIAFISLLILPVGYAFILFYIAPLMAAFYTYICFYECYARAPRPMSLLK